MSAWCLGVPLGETGRCKEEGSWLELSLCVSGDPLCLQCLGCCTWRCLGGGWGSGAQERAMWSGVISPYVRLLYLGPTDASGSPWTPWNYIRLWDYVDKYSFQRWVSIAIIWFSKGLCPQRDEKLLVFHISSNLGCTIIFYARRYIMLPIKKDVYQKQKYFVHLLSITFTLFE